MNNFLRRLLLFFFPSKNILHIDYQATKHDTAYMMMATCFEMLRAYVEIDKAYVWSLKNESPGPQWYNAWFWRDATAGIAQLKDESETLLPSGAVSKTAKNAKEILDLYTWWENRRKTVYGWEPMLLTTPADELEDIVDASEKEDQAMFVRLLKIRPFLVS
jgi:hypothetical protein